MWTGFVWLRIGTGGELFWIRYWTIGFHKLLGNHGVSKQLGISRVVLSSTFIALLLTRSANTQLALCEACCGAPWCYWCGWLWWPGNCGWSRLTALLLGDCWECACSSLMLAWWGVLFSEAQSSRRVDPAGSHLSLCRPAPVCGCVVTYRTCRTSSTAGNVRANQSEASRWLRRLSYMFFRPVLRGKSLICFSADCQGDTCFGHSFTTVSWR
jgi:hypothetical protein